MTCPSPVQLPLDGLTIRGERGPAADLVIVDDPLPGMWVLHLPRWDTAFEVKKRRGGWPVIDPKTGKVRKVRPVWEALSGNARVHYAQRHKATREVICAVIDAATKAGLRPCRYMEVTLVWAPGHNRVTDEDNRWPLLKACCDALARGPRKDIPGLHLLPDDDSRHMRKSVRIDPPPAPPGLYLELVCKPLLSPESVAPAVAPAEAGPNLREQAEHG